MGITFGKEQRTDDERRSSNEQTSKGRGSLFRNGRVHAADSSHSGSSTGPRSGKLLSMRNRAQLAARGRLDKACQVDLQEYTRALQAAAKPKPGRWKKGDPVGSGSFGTVFLGLNCETGELLAIKEVAMNIQGAHQREAMEQLEQELNLLSSLDHPNIVRYIGTEKEGGSLFIFLEYVPGGSIASLVARFGPLEEAVIKVYTRQLLAGLAYLHAQRVVHRDVKGANLLVEKDGHVKLADFGMAKQMVEAVSFTQSFKGSAFWMAPEVIRQQGHGIPADIWSVGCTVLEMATGKPPWAQCTTQVQAIFKIASSQELPAIPDSLSPAASEFVLLCLQRDPAARPSAAELLQHPFVAAPAPQRASAVPLFRSPVRGGGGGLSGGTGGWMSRGRNTAAAAAGGGGGGGGEGVGGGGPTGTWSGGPGQGAAAHPAAAGGGGQAAGAGPRLGSVPEGLGDGEEEDVSEQLAALVLGTVDGAAEQLMTAQANGDGLPWQRTMPRVTRQDGWAFTSQPQLLRVRGLVSLPLLRMPGGQQELPPVKFRRLPSNSSGGGGGGGAHAGPAGEGHGGGGGG